MAEFGETSPQYILLESQLRNLEAQISETLIASESGIIDCQDWTDSAVDLLTEIPKEERCFSDVLYCRSESEALTHSWLEVVLSDDKNTETFVWDGSHQFLPKTILTKSKVSNQNFLLTESQGVDRTSIFELDD